MHQLLFLNDGGINSFQILVWVPMHGGSAGAKKENKRVALELVGGPRRRSERAQTGLPTVTVAEVRHGPREWPQAPAVSPSVSPFIHFTNNVEQKKQIAGRYIHCDIVLHM